MFDHNEGLIDKKRQGLSLFMQKYHKLSKAILNLGNLLKIISTICLINKYSHMVNAAPGIYYQASIVILTIFLKLLLCKHWIYIQLKRFVVNLVKAILFVKRNNSAAFHHDYILLLFNILT